MTINVFGLTGGIGSGKSTAAGFFRERGVPIVDADELAREAVAPGSAGLAQVALAFGPQILAADGSLDRKQLGAQVFADAEARKRLNAITHPIVRQLAQERFAALDQAGVTLAGYDVPLLFEVGLDSVLRPVVVVVAREATQLQRIVGRDGLSEAAARERMASQMPLSEKQKRADYVLYNNGTPEALAAQVDAVLEKLRADAGA
ncbi:MAG TPA: dephospho-CoA kinase [Polyangiaceae bacterium]|nr:dephospho-CoA kinase [Polyangiaceae bacterium]